MSKRIKGLNIEIGADTKGLDKALGGIESQSRKTASELKDVQKLLKFNPEDTELLAQKQKLFGDQVAQAAEKLDKLKEAQDDVNDAFQKGEISEEQYRAFNREVIEAESKLEHFEKQLDSTQTKQDGFGDKLDKLAGKFNKVGESMTSVGTGMSKTLTAPIVAGGAGILALATQSGEAADRLLDLKEISGLTTDTIQEYQHVATVAGVSSEAVTNAVAGFVKKIPQLEKEGGAATEAMDKLGLSFGDLQNMTPDQQMDAIINKMAEMDDPLQRNTVGAALFGGAWQDMAPILSMGADGIAAARDEAHDLGRVMGEDSLNNANNFRIEMDKLKGTISGAALSAGAELAPVLSEQLGPIIEETIVPMIKGFSEKVKELVTWFSSLSPEMQETILKAVGMAAALGPVLVVGGKLIQSVQTITTVVKGAGLAMAGISAPVAIAVGAIAGAIAIGVLLYKNWDEIKEKAAQLAAFIGEKFENIKNSITSKVDAAKEGVRNAIEKIKGFFDFQWDLPKLKMPHFSIKGKFSLTPPSVPKVAVDWYAKGGIFNAPQIIGVGEGRGPEAVLPIEKLSSILADTLSRMGSGGSSQANGNMTVNHTGTITMVGVSNDGEYYNAVDMVMDELRRDGRR